MDLGTHMEVHGTLHEVFVRTKKEVPLTARQEVFCWRYALHTVAMRAYREAYETKSPQIANVNSVRNLRKPKIIDRIKELREAHKNGEIDLEAGPWEHYGDRLEGIGSPDARYAPRFSWTAVIKDGS